MPPEAYAALASVISAAIPAAVALYLGRDRARLRRELAERPTPSREATRTGSFPALGPPRPCVLVVDDERSIPAIVARACAQDGLAVDVHTATKINEAITMIRRHRYDVALLDVHLPDGNVGEIVRALRAPILFFSGDAEAATKAAQDHGGTVVDKSDIDAIVGAISEAVKEG